jgi:hypothetical protein
MINENSFNPLKVFSETQRVFLAAIKNYAIVGIKENHPYSTHLFEAVVFHNKSVNENQHEHCAHNCPLNATTISVFISGAFPETFIFIKNFIKNEEQNE